MSEVYEYDVVVLGGGPAGLSAALYAARAELKTAVLEGELLGGQIGTTTHVENYPGSIVDCTGPALIERMEQQAMSFGAQVVYDEAVSIKKEDRLFEVLGESGDIYRAKAVIASLGASPVMLGIDGEERLRGRGVSYCATCDAGFFRDMDVAVVGGGDTALQESIFLTKFAKKVYVVHRRDEFRGGKALQNRVFENEKIQLVLNSTPERILGDEEVTGLEVKNKVTGEVSTLDVSGVFMFVGYNPDSALVKDFADTDQRGYVMTEDDMSVREEGLFVAGDVRKKPLRQAITAASDGAIAAVSAELYIDHNF